SGTAVGGALIAEEPSHTQVPGSADDRAASASQLADARISALLREKARQADRSAPRQPQRLIADSRAALAEEEYRSRRRLHSAAMFLQAFAAFPDRRRLLSALRALLA